MFHMRWKTYEHSLQLIHLQKIKKAWLKVDNELNSFNNDREIRVFARTYACTSTRSSLNVYYHYWKYTCKKGKLRWNVHVITLLWICNNIPLIGFILYGNIRIEMSNFKLNSFFAFCFYLCLPSHTGLWQLQSIGVRYYSGLHKPM